MYDLGIEGLIVTGYPSAGVHWFKRFRSRHRRGAINAAKTSARTDIDTTGDTVSSELAAGTFHAKRFLIGRLKMRKIVIVSDGWHLPRALLMCKWSNVKADGFASRYRMSFQAELFNRFRESAGLQAYMLFGA